MRSHASAANNSRTLQVKVMHCLTIKACHPRMTPGQPRNLGYLSTLSLSQEHISRQQPSKPWETSGLPPSDAQRRTIYALSTPPGKAGVAVIRVSGPNALDVWQGVVDATSLISRKGKAQATEPEPWKMHRCKIIHPQSREVLDDGLAVFFKGMVNSLVWNLNLT